LAPPAFGECRHRGLARLGIAICRPGGVAAWAGSIVTAYVGGRSLEKIARTIWRRP
jgi:hypothetical protein